MLKSIESFYVKPSYQLLKYDYKYFFSANVIDESDYGVAHMRMVVDALFSEAYSDCKGFRPFQDYLQDPFEIVPVSGSASGAAVVTIADVFHSGAEVAHYGVEEEAGQACDQLLAVLVFCFEWFVEGYVAHYEEE